MIKLDKNFDIDYSNIKDVWDERNAFRRAYENQPLEWSREYEDWYWDHWKDEIELYISKELKKLKKEIILFLKNYLNIKMN